MSKAYDLYKAGIIGAGKFGTALASIFAKSKYIQSIILFSKNKNKIDDINSNNTNNLSLPGILLPKKIKASLDYKKLSNLDIIVISVASPYFTKTLLEIKSHINLKAIILIATKAINENNKLLTDTTIKTLKKDSVAFISGPNLADELAKNLFTKAVIASNNENTSKILKKLLSNDNFNIITSTQLTLVQIASVMKNIISIAAGIFQGFNMGENAISCIIAKGIDEINMLKSNINNNKDEIKDVLNILYADLILSSSSKKTRNFKYGYNIATNIINDNSTEKDNIVENNSVEGKENLTYIYNYLTKLKIKLPLIDFTYHFLSSLDILTNNSKDLKKEKKSLLVNYVNNIKKYL